MTATPDPRQAPQGRRDALVEWVTYAPFCESEVSTGAIPTLAEGVRLVAMPEWVHGADILRYLSERARDSLKEHKFALAVEYQADSLGMPDPTWTADEDGRPRSIQHRAEKRLIYGTLALWLARPTGDTLRHVLHAHRSGGHWYVQQAKADVNLILAHPSDADQRVDAATFVAARPIHEALLGLDEGGAVTVAIRALLEGLRVRSTTMRFVMCWVAAEALFGAADGREVTFRLATRVASFLRPNGVERAALAKSVRDGYSWRSKVVHGTGLAKFTHDDWLRECHRLETWLRESLRKILLQPGRVGDFDGKKREEYLDALAFT